MIRYDRGNGNRIPQACGNTIYLNLRLVYHPRRFTTAQALESKNGSVSSQTFNLTRQRALGAEMA